MWHVDLPTADDLRGLAVLSNDPFVTLYLPTTPVTPDAQADRVAFGNLSREALAQVAAGHRTPVVDVLATHLDDLAADDDFWAHQAHGLAVFATASGATTFRLPEPAGPVAVAGDAAFLKPLVPIASAPRSSLVLALSEDGARLIESTGTGPAQVLPVAGMPRSAADHAGKASINDRSHSGRLVGDEGKQVLLRAYARAVDAALRPLLRGDSEPLVLAAAEPIGQLFRSVCSYPHLLADGVAGSPDRLNADELAVAAAPVLAAHRAAAKAQLLADLHARQAEGRAALELSTVARAAAQGAIATLLVDTTADVPGDVDAAGAITPDERVGGVTEALVRRTFATGGAVVHVDAADLPGGNVTAAVLRWPV